MAMAVSGVNCGKARRSFTMVTMESLRQSYVARGIPLILETPQLNMEIADDDASPDPYDVQMMALLEPFTR